MIDKLGLDGLGGTSARVTPYCTKCGMPIDDMNYSHLCHSCLSNLKGGCGVMDDIDLNKCPNCGGPADNGHDRCYPPNPYYCTKCQDNYHPEPAAPEPLGDSEGAATQVVAGLEPFGYIDGRGRFFYAHDPYYKDTNAGMPRVYSAATVERLMRERDIPQNMVLDIGGQLAASQAREQQLREALDICKKEMQGDKWDSLYIDGVLSLPQDDSALREWGAKLLREMARSKAMWAFHELMNKADELENKK